MLWRKLETAKDVARMWSSNNPSQPVYVYGYQDSIGRLYMVSRRVHIGHFVAHIEYSK